MPSGKGEARQPSRQPRPLMGIFVHQRGYSWASRLQWPELGFCGSPWFMTISGLALEKDWIQATPTLNPNFPVSAISKGIWESYVVLFLVFLTVLQLPKSKICPLLSPDCTDWEVGWIWMCCARNSGWINITLGFALYSAFNHFRNALLRTVGIPETGNHSALCSLNAKKIPDKRNVRNN